MDVKGLSVAVTGAASGLGAATAKALAARGAKVALLDRNAEAVMKTAAGMGGLGVACDVTDAKGAAEALEAVRQANGPLRVLVNCAGIGTAKRILGRDGPMALDDFAKVVQVNLIGSFNMMRLAAAQMSGQDALAEGERGVIVSTASVAAYDGQVGQAAYAASKGGLVSLTLPAAREFAQFGIRVLTIAPGLFATPLMNELPEHIQVALGESVPFPRRLGKPEEYADLVLSCIGNPMLNGEVIRLDGALRLPPR